MGLKHNWKRIRESFERRSQRYITINNNKLTLSLTSKHATTTSIATEQTGIYKEPKEYSQSTHLQHTGINTTNYNEEIQRWPLESQDNNKTPQERRRQRRERWSHPRNNSRRRSLYLRSQAISGKGTIHLMITQSSRALPQHKKRSLNDSLRGPAMKWVKHTLWHYKDNKKNFMISKWLWKTCNTNMNKHSPSYLLLWKHLAHREF